MQNNGKPIHDYETVIRYPMISDTDMQWYWRFLIVHK